MKILTKTFLLICLAVSAQVLPVQAAEVPDVVRVFLNVYKIYWQAQPTYDSISEDSGNIIINNFSIVKPTGGSQSGMRMTVDKIVFGNISNKGNGLYEIGQVSASGSKIEIKGADGSDFIVEVPKSSAETLYMQDPGENPAPVSAFRAAMTLARKMSSGPMTLTTMGHTLTSDGYQTTWDGDPKTGAGNFTFKFTNVVIPESAMAMIDSTGTLRQLGYSGLVFDLESDGKLDVGADKLGLDLNFAYIGRDMGALRFSIGAGDIPLAVFNEVQKANMSGKEPDFTALMPELQNVSFSRFTFRFEDSSITKKVLPIAAAMQGMDEATMVASTGAMLQIGLMQLKNQAFTDQVVGAVNRFLKDPQSITLAIKPAAPLKVQELMMLNPATPGEAIDKLGVSVSAND